jgi:hypothetical protein
MWITISSGILGFSFIFGNSIRTVFESCLTLFVVHPFDVGDTIFIEGGYHVVEEASLNKVILMAITRVLQTLLIKRHWATPSFFFQGRLPCGGGGLAEQGSFMEYHKFHHRKIPRGQLA